MKTYTHKDPRHKPDDIVAEMDHRRSCLACENDYYYRRGLGRHQLFLLK